MEKLSCRRKDCCHVNVVKNVLVMDETKRVKTLISHIFIIECSQTKCVEDISHLCSSKGDCVMNRIEIYKPIIKHKIRIGNRQYVSLLINFILVFHSKFPE